MEFAEKKENGEIRCRFCHYRFVPEPIIKVNGKRRRTYIECPRCGNGIERPVRWYDVQRAPKTH